jgi:hypothetical protein
MNINIKTYELLLNDDNLWIDNISLVAEPAIEVDFMAFAKERPFKFADEDKHIITGAVMIPDKKMWRNDFGGCYVYFSADTCEKAAQRWLMDGKNRSFSVHHNEEVKSVAVVESWVKISDADKSTALGFENIPNGTWFISAKVEDEELWKAVKSGEVNGFSIEGVFAIVENEEDSIIREAEDYLSKIE